MTRFLFPVVLCTSILSALAVAVPAQCQFQTYWGNVGLDTDNLSDPGGGPDPINPVEHVWLDAPAPGTWQVQVHANHVAQDGHVETPAVDADYALVASGVGPVVVDRGSGLAGTLGEPALTVRGFFVDGDLFRSDVTNVPPFSLGVSVLGGANVSVPLFGGVLVPSPDLLTVFLADGSGRASLGGVMAAPALAASSVFVQAWVLDASGPQGFTASSAQEIRVP